MPAHNLPKNEPEPIRDSGWTDGQSRIFESAAAVFAEKGFAATTTGEIARRAGVAEALIFKYFGNKRSLLKRVALPILDYWFAPASVKRLRYILSHPSTDMRRFLTAIFQERRDFIQSHRPFVRIVLQEAMVDPEIRDVLARNFKEHVRPIFIETIQAFQKRGQIRPMPPSTVLRMIVSSFAGYILLTEFVAPDAPWEHEREMTDTIEILLRGLAPDGPRRAAKRTPTGKTRRKSTPRSKGGRR